MARDERCLQRVVHSGQSGGTPASNDARCSGVHGNSAEQNVQRTRWMSPWSWTFRTSFALSLALPFPASRASSLALPSRPARSSRPSMFCVYERRSLRFESRVLINRWVGEGEARSMDCFSWEMNV